MDEIKDPTTDGQQSAKEKPRTAYRVELCFAWAMLLAAVAMFVLTGSSNAFLPAVVGGIWAAIVRSKMKKEVAESVQENIKRIIVCLLVTAVSQLFAPLYVGTTGAWRYPIVREYVRACRTTSVPDWLPDKIPAGSEDYRLDYLPTIMQGSGHFNVRFKCGGEELERWVSFGKTEGWCIFRLSSYAEVSGYSWDDEAASSDAEEGQFALNDFDLNYDKDFWQGSEDGADVYIISATIGWNHPHTEAVIINKDSGMVELIAQ